jgi:hypothetical protein
MWWLDGMDLVAGVMAGFWIQAHYLKPVLPIKVTTLPPEPEEALTYDEWSKLVEPHIRKLTVAAAFDLNYTFKPKGAKAMAGLLKEMGETLDYAATNDLISKRRGLTTSR